MPKIKVNFINMLKFRHKGKEIIEIFNYFIDEMLVKELGGHHNMY